MEKLRKNIRKLLNYLKETDSVISWLTILFKDNGEPYFEGRDKQLVNGKVWHFCNNELAEKFVDANVLSIREYNRPNENKHFFVVVFHFGDYMYERCFEYNTYKANLPHFCGVFRSKERSILEKKKELQLA